MPRALQVSACALVAVLILPHRGGGMDLPPTPAGLMAGSAPAAAAPAAAGDDPLAAWIDAALERNPELLAARERWAASRARTSRTGALEDPMVGVTAERAGTTQLDDVSDFAWMASQRLPWPGSRGVQKKVAALEAEAIGFRYLETSRKIQSEVIQAHWDLWLAQRALDITRETTNLLAQAEANAMARYAAGQAIQADVLRARVERARLDNDRFAQEGELDVARAALNALLADPPDTPRRPAARPPLPAFDASMDDLLAQARKYCCILMSFLRDQQARELAVDAARREARPGLELRVEARQFKGAGAIEEYDTGLAVSVPWLWRGKYGARVAEADAERRMAGADFDEEVNRTLLELREKFTAAETARRTLTLYEATLLPEARSLAESTRAAYRSGQATLLELLESERALKEVRLEYERATAGYAKSHARLHQIAAPWGEREFATGLVTPDMK